MLVESVELDVPSSRVTPNLSALCRDFTILAFTLMQSERVTFSPNVSQVGTIYSVLESRGLQRALLREKSFSMEVPMDNRLIFVE